MDVERLQSIAVKDFDGSNFYISTYRGQPYQTEIRDDKLYLYSKSYINQKSVEENGFFSTGFKIEDLSGVSHNRLCATYRGVEYEVSGACKGLEMLTLKGREDHVTEDIGLGFDYKRISEDQFEKRIKFKEADNIRIISEDVYKELDDKYGYTPYDFSAPSIGHKLSAGAATFIAIIIIILKVVKASADYDLQKTRNSYRSIERPTISSDSSDSISSLFSATSMWTSISESISSAREAENRISKGIKDHSFDADKFLKEGEDLLEKSKIFFEKYDASDMENSEIREQYDELYQEYVRQLYYRVKFKEEFSDEYYDSFIDEHDKIREELAAIWEYPYAVDDNS